MTDVTEQGRKAVEDVATRNHVSTEAVITLLHALQQGHGAAAQFTHPELGGMGQWSKGSMTQIGDMFNDGLKQKVNAICGELSRLLDQREIFNEGNGPHDYSPDGSQWWPGDLGAPGATGGQNDAHYALFPNARRLAVKQGGTVRVYDTGEHRIDGFSQQEGQTLRFSSQSGDIGTSDLLEVK